MLATPVFDHVDALARALAAHLLARIQEADAAKRRFLLGCPGGRSPKPVYEAMARQLAERPADLSHLVIVMMDDYVRETSAGFDHVDGDAHYSCRRFAREELVGVLNQGLPAAARVEPDHVWFPDPADPERYETRIEDAGGIDVFLLASGASDGHIAFNPPGSPRLSRTRLITLAEATRRDNMATFPAFRSIDEVPRHGVSVGIDTIARLSRSAVMILWGEGKQQAFRRIASASRYEADWPATIVTECRDARVVADRAATGASS